MQYLALIHGDADSVPSSDEWNEFFQVASRTGMFQGGSALGTRHLIGTKPVADSTDSLFGFMRFDAVELTQLLELLELHPTIRHGGTIELREMPTT